MVRDVAPRTRRLVAVEQPLDGAQPCPCRAPCASRPCLPTASRRRSAPEIEDRAVLDRSAARPCTLRRGRAAGSWRCRSRTLLSVKPHGEVLAAAGADGLRRLPRSRCSVMLPLGSSLPDEPPISDIDSTLRRDSRFDCHASREPQFNAACTDTSSPGECPAHGPRRSRRSRRAPAAAASGRARPCISRGEIAASDPRPHSSAASGPAPRASDGAGASSTSSRNARVRSSARSSARNSRDQSLGLRARLRDGVRVEQPRDLAALRKIAILVGAGSCAARHSGAIRRGT